MSDLEEKVKEEVEHVAHTVSWVLPMTVAIIFLMAIWISSMPPETFQSAVP